MASVCPRLLATFTNGIVCEYVPGEVLTKALVNHLDVGIRVAAAMAKLHANTASFPIAEMESVLWHRLYSRGEYKAPALSVAMRGLSENLQCKNPPFFINWLDPFDLSKRKKLSDLCYICPRGTREGMPLFLFEKSVFVKHTTIYYV